MSAAKKNETNLAVLMDLSVSDVCESLDGVHDLVDGKFGEGYAAKHPAMLAGCVQACAVFYLAYRLSNETDLTDGVALVADLLTTRLNSLDDAVDGLIERERGEAVGMDSTEAAQ